MRHLRSILYALVLAPAVWILCGVGFDQNLTGRARDNGGIESLSGVLLLVLAGTAYAILLFSPISPAGPFLAGLVFLGAGAWARSAPASYAGAWPTNVAEDGFDVSTPGYGLAVLLAVPLVGTALSARRWRAFEPPELLLIGRIGRSRGVAAVARTPMASEQTAVIPQQRQAPEPSADTTQVVGPTRPAVAQPVDGDGETTVLRHSLPASDRDESTQVVTPAGKDASDALGPDDNRTVDVGRTADLAATRDISPDQPTRDMSPDQPTRDMAVPDAASGAGSEGTTRDFTADQATHDLTAGEATRDIAGDVTTRLPPPAGADTGSLATEAASADDGETTRLPLPSGDAPTDDGDEKTRPLPPNRAAGDPDRGEQTQVIRPGTVQPPGDRTQLLTYRAPSEATTVATPVEPAGAQMSIVGAERPDPGEDPTTRLRLPGQRPGEATTRPNQDRRAMTVTNFERPADEAADDTRRLIPPAQRPPAEDSTS